eukprot:702546-Rhodomonas_salina.2
MPQRGGAVPRLLPPTPHRARHPGTSLLLPTLLPTPAICTAYATPVLPTRLLCRAQRTACGTAYGSLVLTCAVPAYGQRGTAYGQLVRRERARY